MLFLLIRFPRDVECDPPAKTRTAGHGDVPAVWPYYLIVVPAVSTSTALRAKTQSIDHGLRRALRARALSRTSGGVARVTMLETRNGAPASSAPLLDACAIRENSKPLRLYGRGILSG